MAPTSKPISFQTSDNITLRGVLITPSNPPPPTPLSLLILTHGFSLTISQSLTTIATHLCTHLPLACLVYDHRNFGLSDSSSYPNAPRHEVLVHEQISDLRDAITFASTLPNINASKIALWGYSYSGGHALHLAASDHRVKAVIAHAPVLDGYEQMHRTVAEAAFPAFHMMFEQDRLGRMRGEKAMVLPIVAPEDGMPCALPGKEAWEFARPWIDAKPEENEVTVRSLELISSHSNISLLSHIPPKPVLVGVGAQDKFNPSDLLLRHLRELPGREAGGRVEVVVVEGGHFDLVRVRREDGGEETESRRILAEREVEFLRRWLC